MDIPLNELQAECDRAAQEFLAMDGWTCPKAKVRTIVGEMIAGSRVSTATLSWLLNHIERLPVQAEPARRLHDLTEAVAALHARKALVGSMPRSAVVERV